MHQRVGFERDEGVDVVGGGDADRPTLSGVLTPTPTNSNEGCLMVAAITILPTKPVPQMTIRFF